MHRPELKCDQLDNIFMLRKIKMQNYISFK